MQLNQSFQYLFEECFNSKFGDILDAERFLEHLKLSFESLARKVEEQIGKLSSTAQMQI